MTKDLATLAADMGGRWLVADYEAGDMVVHSPYMIHAASVNVDPRRRIRLSTARWQSHWSFDDGL